MIDQQNLLDLINVDDEILYNFKNGVKTNAEIDDNKITKQFKKYVERS